MKTCSKCKIEKDESCFYNYHGTKDKKTSQCKECMSAYRDSTKDKNREYQKNLRQSDNEKVKFNRRKSWRNLDVRKKMYQQSVHRAKRKGVEHNISIEDIIVPEVCPILKTPFVIGTKDNYENTHSLDRIDNNKGYIKGNVQVISKKANSMKNSGGPKELLLLAEWIIKTFK